MSGVVIALDVGGSSIKSGVVTAKGALQNGPAIMPVDSGGSAQAILDSFAHAVRRWLPATEALGLRGIGVAIPGPFDYENGVSLIRSVAKYDSIYGVDVRQALRQRLQRPALPIRFQNDAEAAILGEVLYGAGRSYRRVLGVTLGTGLGSAFVVSGTPVREGAGVPPRGWLYGEPYAGRRADDLFSTRGLQERLRMARAGDAEGSPEAATATAPEYAAAARDGDVPLQKAFAAFGHDLGSFLKRYVVTFNADLVLVLGGIARAYDLFGPALEAEVDVAVKEGQRGATAALLGVAAEL